MNIQCRIGSFLGAFAQIAKVRGSSYAEQGEKEMALLITSQVSRWTPKELLAGHLVVLIGICLDRAGL